MTDELRAMGPGQDGPEVDAPAAGAADLDPANDLEAANDLDAASGVAAAERPAPGVLTEAGLEALLFVAEKPLSRREIGSIAGVDAATVDARLGDLEVSLRGRGIRLIAVGDRVELATAPDAGALVARYVGADAVRLSPAGLETLAIVAYRQPVTKAAVERIRGVDSDHTVRSLLHRRLVVELGRANTPGRPILYGTAFEFLERFGLESLDDLPTLDADVAARLAEEGGALLLQLDEEDPDADGLAAAHGSNNANGSNGFNGVAPGA